MFLYNKIIIRSLAAILYIMYAVFFSTATCAQQITSGDRPNVLLIMTDDAGYGDFGFDGNHQLKTPNLDQLASESTRFTSFYVSPVCAPTRASLLTGRYHQRTGVTGVVEGREFMTDKEVTIAEILRNAGYRTGIFGKWHLGENYPFVPRAQGFDQFIGFLDGSNPYFDTQLVHNGRPYATKGYLTDVLTDRAIHFIKKTHRSGKPFFVYLPYNAPHGPLQVPARYVKPYRNLPVPTRKIYGMMASVDENIGRLMYYLCQVHLERNTLVLFLSDNGPLFHGHQRYNEGLRGHKYTIYEGGMRVPFLIRWPGHVPAGRKVTRLAAHIDVLPTVLDYAGVPLPDSLAMDGRSLRPLLAASPKSRTEWRPRTLFMSYPNEGVLSKIEKGKKSPVLYPGMAVTSRYGEDRFKMVDGNALYNLSQDPGETNNIAAEQPDILKTLAKEYNGFWRNIHGGRSPYPRVQVGHPQENPARLTAHWARLSDNLWWEFSNEDSTGHRGLGVHGDWISRWPAKGGTATWRLRFVANTRYRIGLRARCPEFGKPEVRVQVAGQKIERTLTACGSHWRELSIGIFPVPVGPHNLKVLASGGPGKPDLDLGGINIERLHP